MSIDNNNISLHICYARTTKCIAQNVRSNTSGLTDYLSPLHTEPPALPAKLHIVKVAYGVLCVTLVIHIDKRKACAAKHSGMSNPHTLEKAREEPLLGIY